ncbi:MAG: polyphosphate kinase 1 [Rhodothermaceae bacterium]|nr:polyphosphate kinase 1 [Rhodothermaceae bacterium]
MEKKNKYVIENREISWLSFNARVLQEAADERLPLFERLSFLAIYSSNLDEFFRVRVASMRSLVRLKKKSYEKLDFNPARLVKQITSIVTEQQEQFGAILRDQIVPALAEENIFFKSETDVDDEQARFLSAYFKEHLEDRLNPADLDQLGTDFFVKNRGIYLVTELWNRDADVPGYRLLEIPSDLPRFIELPSENGRYNVMYLDDVIRFNLDKVYKEDDVDASYSIKLTRDGDLYLEDEFSGDVVQMIKKSLKKRETGIPSRLLYDLKTPFSLAVMLKKNLGLKNEDMVLGGRYHNLNDFFGFPRFDKAHLLNEPMPPHAHPELSGSDSIFDIIARKDQFLHVPYQSYDPVIRLFEEAANDELVEDIYISLYRVAKDSAITKALIDAKKSGKNVTVFVEVKARFDEESNVFWTEQMEEAGIAVKYSIEDMERFKVHAKIAVISRREGENRMLYTYLGTGNFNEKTASLYVDDAVLTANQEIGREVEQVFEFLFTKKNPELKHLLVAPFNMRDSFNSLINKEIEEAKAGRDAWMILKMNSLEDTKMIRRLYRANNAGVKIQIIVRGICRLVPGVEGQSENISVISIVDRFLEHARAYVFNHGGDAQIYLASADWMKRNLSRRVEVAFPIYDADHREAVMKMLKIQLSDNQKARVINKTQSNPYVTNDGAPVRAQYELYKAYKG